MSTPTFLSEFESFIATSIDTYLDTSANDDIEKSVLGKFNHVVHSVPAYSEFLKTHHCHPSDILSLNDYKNVPMQTKNNYMRAYSLSQRCVNGSLVDMEMLACSTGSTGEPMFWPRNLAHELEIAFSFEQILKYQFDCDKKSTLAIVGFALGTWIGGMFTSSCNRLLSQKGYKISVVTPGNNITEIHRVIRTLATEYDQIILFGYPPFVKNVLDYSSESSQALDWNQYDIKMVFAGEVFSEAWRDLVCERVNQPNSPLTIASMYGTADGGVLGFETPLSIIIRRFFADHPTISRELFGESRLPTLVQYNPMSRYFEVVDNTLVVSGNNGVPLVRYHIADQGGIISFDEMEKYLKQNGFDINVHAQNILHSQPAKLPFLFLFGRADFTISYYGANIFPENVTIALEQKPFCDILSGKFVLQVSEANNGDKRFEVICELLAKKNYNNELAKDLELAIKNQLLKLNSEFANYVPVEYQMPRVILKSNGDVEFFPPGIKHRYTRENKK